MIQVVHGIHTRRRSRRLRGLCAHLEHGSGIGTIYHEYGDVWAVQSRWVNPRVAERVAKVCRPGGVILGHSNGCAIALRAVMRGAPAQGLVLLNPALEPDVQFPDHLKWVHVYYNAQDGVVPLSNFPILQSVFFDPLWGAMGCVGYRGVDDRVTAFDCMDDEDGMPDLHGHSSIIDPVNARTWGVFIGRNIGQAVKENER